MSEFVKKLEQISREKGQPIGFGGTTRGKMPPMMLVAQLSPSGAGASVSGIDGGADALLFDDGGSSGQIETFSKIASSVGKITWGVRLGVASAKRINELADAGCDYFVFGSEASAFILGDAKMGKVLEVDDSLSDSLARSIGQLPFDAVLLHKDDDSPLTLYKLMKWQRIISLAGKPVLVFLSSDISDLGTLFEIGVRGIVIDIGIGNAAQRISTVRKVIEELPSTAKKPGERISAILPDVQLAEEESEEEL